jgi:hypothetical protein
MQEANLSSLRDLSDEAATSPTAGTEKKLNELWQRFFPGSGATLTADQLASTEKYAKVAEQIAGQQATAMHATDAFLRNQYGANPNLELSRLGRKGITNVLLGNVDAQRTVTNEWQKALRSGQWLDQDFHDWINQFNRGFDPRVFQYARMDADERVKFRSLMSPSVQKQFAGHLQDAMKRGWVDLGGPAQP